MAKQKTNPVPEKKLLTIGLQMLTIGLQMLTTGLQMLTTVL